MLRAADRFATFGGEHLLLVGLFLVGAVAVVLVGRRQRGTPAARRFSRVYAVAIPCVTVPSQAFQLTPGDFDLATSLPLQLCDLAWVAAVWALWTHDRVPVALTYFWGLTLTVQGIITPSLGQAFPHPRYLAFWAMHFLVVWAALYLTLGLGLGPRWREYRVTVASPWPGRCWCSRSTPSSTSTTATSSPSRRRPPCSTCSVPGRCTSSRPWSCCWPAGR